MTARPPRLLLRIGPALEAAFLLAVGRACVLLSLDLLGGGRELDLALFRLSRSLDDVALACGGAGLLAALLTGTARAPRAPAVAVHAALALVFAGVLAGAMEDDPTRRIGLATPLGRMAAGISVAAGAALVAVLAWRVARAERSGAAPLVRAAVPALALAALPLALPPLLETRRGGMTVIEVAHELLDVPAGELPGEALRARADAPPRVGVLTPSTSYRLNGADMRALVLPPPAAVELRVPGDRAETYRLAARAGIDLGVFGGPLPEDASVRFQVAVGGEPRFETEIPLVPVGEPPGSAWVLVGGEEGLAVRGGERLRFATSVRGPGGEIEPERALDAGFGGLACERVRRAPRASSSPDAPSIVLVVMDTERVDRLSAYGYRRPTTPHLERLAARGRLFERAYATSSWTWPSTGSLLTGLHPAEHGADSFTSSFLAESLETLPEVLQRAGYTTAAWSANPLVVPDKNFDQGFETFERAGDSPQQSRTIMPVVLEWLRSVAGTRFFLYLQLMDPHAPLRPDPEAVARFAPDLPPDFDSSAFADLKMRLLRGAPLEETVPAEHRRAFHDLYDAGVWSGDAWLGALLDELDALELLEETVVVYTSDHGEELFDRGLAGHGHTLFPELVQVPLVLAGPGVPARERIDVPVSNRHLAPTLARIGGASLGAVRGALDLARPLSDPEELRRSLLISTAEGWWNGRLSTPVHGLRDGELVLHWAPEMDEARLYDVSRDPELRRDLAPERPADARRLREELERRLAEVSARRVRSAPSGGASTLELLRAIGYLPEEGGR